MFEKSLYDLIRGLRNHKGRERAYIQDNIRECRREVKGQDMDVKATALLKLTYLEMFGHDMSWAAFNVLEVMSSAKNMEKRIGYLAAVQSFRPDTEVLMLAENLLKKDLMSPSPPTIALPLVAVPHLISPSMANSLLPDILPRLTHSHASIRKKTVVTLYRLALVYPDTLRVAWPRMKERLLDEQEDAGVTAAVVNVVCELGWRRPQDFLPLAPRLFELLVDSGNNWMAIKIIKLFAVLTPLEPRLVKKLLPPLTTLIKTTPAMSLLYECINGIIQGGIMETAGGTTEGDEIARLCVSKLRGMLAVEGDPNLKYVALLAFNKIVESHPYLVSFHEDAIMECIDDPDISIRLKALDLVVGMVNASNLTSIVDRLMTQLQDAPLASNTDDIRNDRGLHEGVEPLAVSDDEDVTQSIGNGRKRKSKEPPPLPDEYRTSVIERILQMCSQNTYANISDFDWYLDVLVSMVRCVPASTNSAVAGQPMVLETGVFYQKLSLAQEIGVELRNVAVRVRSSRQEAVQAAERLVATDQRARLLPANGNGGQSVLGPAAWVVGEFADMLIHPHGTLDSLLMSETHTLTADVLSIYIQGAMKVFAHIGSNESQSWSSERRTMITLLLARLIHWLEPLTTHPSLEIQERSVEFLELARLATEAIKAHAVAEDGSYASPPLLLTEAIPSLFRGTEINPVARDAQRKVPIPDDLDLDTPINPHLSSLLSVSEPEGLQSEDDEFDEYYYEKPKRVTAIEPAANLLPNFEHVESYQGNSVDPEVAARRRAERKERYKDDPFYIPSEDNSGSATPIESAIRASNGESFDVDSIPIMELKLDSSDSDGRALASRQASYQNRKKPPRRNFEILADDDIAGSGANSTTTAAERAAAVKRSLLQVDSSGLGSLSLNDNAGSNAKAAQLAIERRAAEEEEMAQAMREVERLRLEMQRAQERVESKESTVVRKKTKKKPRPAIIEGSESAPADVAETSTEKPSTKKKKKKKKKKVKVSSAQMDAAAVAQGIEGAVAPKKKKKKRREAVIEEEAAAVASEPAL